LHFIEDITWKRVAYVLNNILRLNSMFTSLIDKGAAIITNMAYDWLIDCGVFTLKVLLRLSEKYENSI